MSTPAVATDGVLKQDYLTIMDQFFAAQQRNDIQAATDYSVIAVNMLPGLTSLENEMLIQEGFRDAICDQFGLFGTAPGPGTGGDTDFVYGIPISVLLAANATVNCISGWGELRVVDETGNTIWHWEGEMVGCHTANEM